MNDFVGLPGISKINMQGDYGIAQYGDDTRLVVKFFMKSVLDQAQSRNSAMPIHKNIEYVEMHAPGERLNIVCRPVTDSDKFRFPVQWSQFINKREQRPEGTPVDLLFPNNPAVADNLRAHAVFTIQQLANLSASGIDTIGMGGQDWVNMAKKYIANATDGIAFHKMQEELKKTNEEKAVLEYKVSKLQEQLDGLMARFVNPNANSMQPAWQPGFDAQAERLDANHPSQEIAQAQKKKKKPIITLGEAGQPE